MLLLLECLPILSIKTGFLRTICKKKRSYPRSGLHYRNGSRVKIDRDREIRIEISGIDLSRSKITVQKSLRGEQRSDNRTVRVGGRKWRIESRMVYNSKAMGREIARSWFKLLGKREASSTLLEKHGSILLAIQATSL